jgi:hypothetical protein
VQQWRTLYNQTRFSGLARFRCRDPTRAWVLTRTITDFALGGVHRFCYQNWWAFGPRRGGRSRWRAERLFPLVGAGWTNSVIPLLEFGGLAHDDPRTVSLLPQPSFRNFSGSLRLGGARYCRRNATHGTRSPHDRSPVGVPPYSFGTIA